MNIKQTRNKYIQIFINYPVTTTIKSMTFQGLRRYEPRCNTNPNAMILRAASKQNIPIK
jgi:phage baseplate assembly protein W